MQCGMVKGAQEDRAPGSPVCLDWLRELSLLRYVILNLTLGNSDDNIPTIWLAKIIVKNVLCNIKLNYYYYYYY